MKTTIIDNNQTRDEGKKSSSPPLQAGDKLWDGHYEIISDTPDAGGFGRIYRAYGSRYNVDGTRHEVAIKEFYVNEMEDNAGRSVSIGSYTRECTDQDIERWREQFYKETQILRRLNMQRDRHVPWVHAYGGGQVVFEDKGRLFYAMTFINGKTLTQLVKENGRPLKEAVALDYIVQVAKLLYKAHSWGVVHCDISPSNIMLQDGYAVLVDFGNAMSYDYEWVMNNAPNLCYVDVGMLGGTPGFFPPEEYIGSSRGDIYSLCATLFYLLTGKKPGILLTEQSKNSARGMLEDKDVSEETTEAIMRTLDIDAEQCITDAKGFLAALPQDAVLNTLLNYSDSKIE